MLLEHSPLGASGAERWMQCPGSVTLSQGVQDSESDHSLLGQAAHSLGALALLERKQAWEYIGSTINGAKVDIDMADAVQVYLDAVRRDFPGRNQGNSWVERKFHCPEIHPLFYGTSDFAYWDNKDTLSIRDYKHGAGVVVEVQHNAQQMYYAVGMIKDLGLVGRVKWVSLGIIQPRGFHASGPVREWTISVESLFEWLEGELLPAMKWAMVSRDTISGEHCRFCPARSRACPQLMRDMDELEAMMKEIEQKGGAEQLTNEQVGRFLDLLKRAKIVGTAAMQTAFARLNAGHSVPGYKLAAAKANRVWKENAEPEIAKALGKDAYSEPELLSPAKIEKLPGGKALAQRFAFKPDAGLTVVEASDTRRAVNRDTKSMFVDVTQQKVV